MVSQKGLRIDLKCRRQKAVGSNPTGPDTFHEWQYLFPPTTHSASNSQMLMTNFSNLRLVVSLPLTTYRIVSTPLGFCVLWVPWFHHIVPRLAAKLRFKLSSHQLVNSDTHLLLLVMRVQTPRRFLTKPLRSQVLGEILSFGLWMNKQGYRRPTVH